MNATFTSDLISMFSFSEDDRTILSVCHNRGATVETFQDLSRRLTGKSASEVCRVGTRLRYST